MNPSSREPDALTDVPTDQVILQRVLARRAAGGPPKAEPGADAGPRRSAAAPP